RIKVVELTDSHIGHRDCVHDELLVNLVRIAAEWAAGFNYRSQLRLAVFPEGVVFLRIDPPEKLGVLCR
ncbi:hypothetical protein, partial [Eikenella halliae]|uniref:hypothetical protein n=1 Tax=Eikenella halliae TaxID=1795832 RepID=UPI003613B381